MTKAYFFSALLLLLCGLARAQTPANTSPVDGKVGVFAHPPVSYTHLAQEVGLQAMLSRPPGAKMQQALADVATQINAYGLHVASNLGGGFLESNIQSMLAVSTGLIRKMSGQRGFAAASGARNEDRRTFEEPFTLQHGVQIFHAGRNALFGNFVIQANGR